MKDFLIESTLGMAVLLAVYYLFLEREKMHRFNRFYLLFSLLFSLIMPFISVPVYTEAAEVAFILPVTETAPAAVVAEVAAPDYLLYIIGAVYAAGSIFIAFRFIRNIINLRKKAASGTIVRFKTAKLVLLDEKILPHTFLNYIFLNKADYDSQNIEEELYIHELTHVNQRHTLDLLFVEAVKIILWFNPLPYFFKKAIQLNHLLMKP
jgi:beta-lactamase regulating signal transducer with metallopeptidase domain